MFSAHISHSAFANAWLCRMRSAAVRLIQSNGSPAWPAQAGVIGVQPRRLAGRSAQDVTVSAVITPSTAASGRS